MGGNVEGSKSFLPSMTDEERPEKLLAGHSNTPEPGLHEASTEEIPIELLEIESIDTSLLTEEQKSLESELLLFPRDEALWQQLLHTIKVITPNAQPSSKKKKDGERAMALQDRAWKDHYLRNVYRRMLTGPFKCMGWLWVEYLLFEVSLLGFQLPSATLLPTTKRAPVSSAFPEGASLEKAFKCAREVSYSPNVWILYLNYLKKKISMTALEELPLTQEKQHLVPVYEAALRQVGLDIFAGSIWADYVSFLKSEKARCTCVMRYYSFSNIFVLIRRKDCLKSK
jgi:hypothetical protein